jgi:hypothetical protein
MPASGRGASAGSFAEPFHHVRERQHAAQAGVALIEGHFPRLEERKADVDAAPRAIDDHARIAALVGRAMENILWREVESQQRGPAPSDGGQLLAAVGSFQEGKVAAPTLRWRQRKMTSTPREMRLSGKSGGTSMVPARISMPMEPRNAAMRDRCGSRNMDVGGMAGTRRCWLMHH